MSWHLLIVEGLFYFVGAYLKFFSFFWEPVEDNQNCVAAI